MASFNKVLLMGNLTRNPQLSYTPNQTAVCDFGIATNRKWNDQSGNPKDEVCFVDCRAFGRQAETIDKYLTKGRPVFVEGRLTYDSWTAQDGSKRSRLRVTLESFQFIPTGQGNGQQASQGSTNQGQQRRQQQQNQAPPPTPTPQQQSSQGHFAPESDFPHDDIPF